MTVKHEIKSQLAKLLATEDLIVEHKKVETAQFNVHTRVLILPMWEKASNTVYDMLVGHEVGHALFTPDRNWLEDYKINPSIVNIVEDARIEKLMKRKYAGLAKSFYHGYEELNNDDFFSIDDEDLTTFSFADRINLHYKIGNFVDISFSDAEDKIVRLVGECETFEDVLKASQLVDELCKVELKEKVSDNGDGAEMQVEMPSSEKTESKTDEKTDDELLDELTKSEESGSEESEESEELPKDEKPTEAENKGGTTAGDTDIDIKTVDSLADKLKDLTSEHARENTYVEVPQVKLDQFVVSNEEIHEHCRESWDPSTLDRSKVSEYLEWQVANRYDFDEVDQKFEEFKTNAKKEVNYLVKEFECKKSASAYARAATNRTGVLDTTKLHTYRYNEDIFKRITTLPDGKNHGLIFILDWSGSMNEVMLDTIKQLYNLMWFCKKVQIPFEVYAFTNDYPMIQFNSDGEPRLARITPYEPKENLLVVAENFTLMNYFTSKVNSKTLNEQMKNIFRIAYAFSHRYVSYDLPCKLRLSGTPLNESLIALHQIIPQFKAENKVEKVQCMILTDGEGANIPYHRTVQRRWEDSGFLGHGGIHTGCFLRDRKTGHTYAFTGSWYDMSDILLHNLRHRFPEVNFIGMRLLAKRDAGYFIRNYAGSYGKEYEDLMRSWKKIKSFSIKSSGYNTYFGLCANSISEDTDFEVKEDATKAQIRSAFKKSLNGKKMNKKVLSEFIELVA